MERRVIKAIQDYHDRFGGTQYGTFYTSDMYCIDEISKDKFELIANALRAGFMIGYRKGKRDAAEKTAGRRKSA